MSEIWNKLDTDLSSIYANYLRARQEGGEAFARAHPAVASAGRLHVSLVYDGNLGEIEALGFQTAVREGDDRATGQINLADLEQLAAHAGVLKISFSGRRPRPLLDHSVPDIRAREIPPQAGVWSQAGGTFSGNTGAGVIVGIVDSGIDFHHPFFIKANGDTRILRIWDPGLILQSGESPPDATSIYGSGGGPTYGVEYREGMINNVLHAVPGAQAVRHRDCNGHGTYCAAIAAGNGRPALNFIGVAPEADLVIVKYGSYEHQPQLGGAPIDYGKLFRDAVNYILNIADELHRPVVINHSMGSSLGPHDGFTDDEDFLTNRFSGAVGKVFVGAAGNDANARQHARIEFPAGGGSVDIPFRLCDPRTHWNDFDTCRWENHSMNPLSLQLYYPFSGPAGPPTLSVELHVGAGSLVGPALGGTLPGTIGGRPYTLIHTTDSQSLRGGRGTVNRNVFQVDAYLDNNWEFRRGIHTLHVTATGEMTVHAWCAQGHGYGFFLGTDCPPHAHGFSGPVSGLPPNVFAEDLYQIASPGGAQNIITLAGYDAEAPDRGLYPYSSHGPLVNYHSGPTQPFKPDIAAPGMHIDSAWSSAARPRRGSTFSASGTSAAAPHVAGAVALLLQRNHNLNLTQIHAALGTGATLRAASRTAETSLDANEAGVGRLDAKAAFDATSP